MPQSLSAEFDTRRDAEMAVEHIVQEHGLDRKAVTIVAASDENSAGTRAAGGDIADGAVDPGDRPALAGRLRVSVEADEAARDKVLKSFATYGGRVVG